MVTLYELLEVDEKATKEEIESSYQSLLIEYKLDPSLSAEENNENEMILDKLKMAFEILNDDVKRAQYDRSLSQKRAEDLLRKLPNSIDNENSSDNNLKEDGDISYNNDEFNNFSQEDLEEHISNVELTKEEKDKLKKAAKKEFNENLKKAKMAEELYQKEYNKAYNEYLRKMGMKIDEPITLKKIKRIIITIFSIIIVCFISWKIPFIQKKLIEIYNSNFVIKALVDIIRILIKSVFELFKK